MMQVAEKAEETRFLGSEFLLWLWFKSETDRAFLDLGPEGEAELHLQGKMTLESQEEQSREVLTCSGGNPQMKEARFAVSKHKMLTEAGLRLSTPDGDWTFSLEAKWMNFKSLRITGAGAESDEDPEGFFYEKAALVEKATTIVDKFFAHFISLRLSPHWESEELPAIREWIRKGGKG